MKALPPPTLMFWIALWVCCHHTACAQEECQRQAQEFFYRNNIAFVGIDVGKKCVELDLSQSVDRKGKEYVYRWRFGDGTAQDGLKVGHCYREYGLYAVTLDLVDRQSGMVIRNEFSTELTLIPPLHALADTLSQRELTLFQFDQSLFPNYTVKDVFWRVEDKLYCGKAIEHAFAGAGAQLVEMGVIGLPSHSARETMGYGLTMVWVKRADENR